MVPILLVIKQPDYGTAMVMLAIIAFMLFVGGLDYRYIIAAAIVVAVGVPLAYQYVLPEHAKDRITVFLNPETDPQGAGYNIIQAKLAVGSGQMWGMGLLEGNQTQLGYLPMKVTDFIYAVISEEMGFVFSVTVVGLFVLLIIRGYTVAKTAEDVYGSLIATGVTTMWLAHFLENVGMNIGLMPITGIPLPFISYCGCSMITNFIGLGLLLSVSAKRNKKMFE
jgi:rod shape determining protein RodA